MDKLISQSMSKIYLTNNSVYFDRKSSASHTTAHLMSDEKRSHYKARLQADPVVGPILNLAKEMLVYATNIQRPYTTTEANSSKVR